MGDGKGEPILTAENETGMGWGYKGCCEVAEGVQKAAREEGAKRRIAMELLREGMRWV